MLRPGAPKMFKLKRVVFLSLLFAFSSASVRAVSTATNTALAIAPGTSVAAGPALPLTATVTTSPGGVPVPRGTVIFCDATATFCEGSAVLGVAQVQANGTASSAMVLGVGSYSVVAHYAG